MKYLVPLIFIFTSLLGMSQNEAISVDVAKENDTLIFFVSNNTDFTQDVIFTVKDLEGLEGNTNPLLKRINPQVTDIFHKLKITGPYNYNFDFLNEFPKEHLINEAFTVGDDILLNKGIVIFEKTDCGRCQTTMAYLNAKNKPYAKLNITDNPMYNQLMWELLELNGYLGDSVKTPVILVNGAISFSHEDLEGFLEQL